MTAAEYRAAAAAETPVRLKDRASCFWTNEWYRPVREPNGGRGLATYTGEWIKVDNALLCQLTPAAAGTTGEDIARMIDEKQKPACRRPGSQREYLDVRAAAVRTIAVESRSTGQQRHRHGPAVEASGNDPVEDVLVLETV